jgi:hypothetical protein
MGMKRATGQTTQEIIFGICVPGGIEGYSKSAGEKLGGGTPDTKPDTWMF